MHDLKGWVYEKLGDLPILFIDSDRSKRYPKRSEFQDQGIAFLNAESISSGRFDRTKVNHIPYEKYEEIKKGRVKNGDIVLTMRGNGVGDAALIFGEGILGLINAQMLILRPNDETINSKFLYYGFISPQFKCELSNFVSGSAQPQLTMTHLRHVPFRVPPLAEQKAIAHILGSLDDKIELNRQMNETLEAMAQALFKSWFVDFDPVIDNALAAGNAIPDEFFERAEQRKAIEKKDNSNIQDLFPNEFEFTEEMGWIPKGWNIQSFGDLLDSTIGGDWGKPEQDDKHTRESVIIRGTDIPKLKLGERSEAPKRWVEEKKLKTRILKPFDIVVEISGGSPTQSTGRSIIITEQILERLGGVAEPASFCRKFSPLNKFLGLYAGIHLQKIYDDGKMWEYQNQSTGISNFQTTSFLEREELVVPSESVLLKFYETLEPIISKMSSNQQIELARLRDTLLPKLMSGELRIVDAAEMVEDA